MEQLGRPGLRQRAASATYDVLAVMLFNIIHIVFFQKLQKNEVMDLGSDAFAYNFGRAGKHNLLTHGSHSMD